MNVPTLLNADLAVDDRGQLTFCNDLDFVTLNIRRMYLTKNHQVNFIRAWHAHRKEAKYVMAVSGAALVCAVGIGDWAFPNSAAKVERHILSAALPRVLAIPPGYANGWKSLTPDCQLLWFSTATAEESAADDYRWDARYWNPWEVKER